MKPRLLSIARLSFPLASAIAALLATPAAHAAIYYWDGNNGTAGFGTAAGTWAAPTTGTATSGWSTDATGATVVLSNSVTTATTDTLNFGTATAGLAAGTITVSGTVDAGDITFGSASGAIVLSGGTINLAAASTITVNNTTDTISSILTGAGTSFTKAGSGTLTLNGSAVNTFTGSLNVNGGTLLLDFANRATPTNLINSGNALSLSGGTLSIKGKSTGTTSQTLGNVTVNAGGGRILGDKNGGTSTTIALGTITANTAGGTLLLGAGGTNANLPVITTTSTNDATGILGGRIVYFNGTANTGYDFATGGTVGAYASYTAMPLTGGSSSVNYSTAAGGTLSGAVAANTLKIVGSATALALGTNLMTINSGGLLSTGTTAQTISGTAGGTTLTAGNGSGSYELIVHQYNSGGLTISAVIGNNGANAVSLVKSGTGTLTLSGTNTFTGGLTINAGNVNMGTSAVDSLGASGSTVTVNATTLLSYNGVTTFNKSFVLNNNAILYHQNGNSPTTITGAVTGTGGIAPQGAGSVEQRTLTLQSTANTFAGPIVLGWTSQNFGAISVVSLLDDATHTGAITFGTGASSYGSFIWGAGGPSALTLNNRQILFTGSAATSTGVIKNNNTTNAITINTALAVDGVGSKTLQLDGVAGPTNVFAGVIGNGSGTVSLTKAGAGTWTLSGSNTYTGATTITSGILDFANKAAKTAATATAAAAGSVGLGVKASDAAYYSATDVGNLFNTNTLAGFSLNAASGVAIDTTNAGADFDQTVALTAGRALTKLGTGTLVLSNTNTYTGATTVSGGALIVNGNISTSSLTTVNSGATLAGTGTLGATTIQGGATLEAGNGGVGTLTLNSTTLGLNDTSILNFDFNPLNQAVGAGINDLVTGINGFTLDGVLNVTATSGDFLGAVNGAAWRLFNYNGALINNTLNINSMPSLAGGLFWSVDTSVANQVNLTVIPEPHAALLGSLGLIFLLRRRRR